MADPETLENVPPNCPYQKDFALSLEYRPLLRDLDSKPSTPAALVTVRVQHVFVPFTYSQAMIVEVLDADRHALPKTAVLKLYDRRWTKERYDRDWEEARESGAQAYWEDLEKGVVAPVENFRAIPRETWTDAYYEENWRRICQERFETELEAYRRLISLQGAGILRCYGSVQFTPSNAIHLPQLAVNGILLEYFPGERLSSFRPFSSVTYSRLFRPVMASAASFPSLGVIHDDIDKHNILINSNRAVLIDFGEAVLRTEDIDDEKWDDMFVESHDLDSVRHLLNISGFRDRSPKRPFWGTRGVYIAFNQWVHYGNREWRRRWYRQLLPDMDDEKLTPPREPMYELKDDVRAWLDSRPDVDKNHEPPESFMVARPGSPP